MRISYAVTVCNEFLEIQRLLKFLLENKRTQDEIVILYDGSNGDAEIESFLRANSINGGFVWHKANFENHFADWKNYLTSLCKGDYIFQIDADEIPTKTLMDYLPDIIDSNPNVDVLLVPRINTVDGLTKEHIAKWGWNVNQDGWVNFPDYQWRIYKNNPDIKWVNKVHERLEGYRMMSSLPSAEEFCLHHPKTIDRQERQNSYYESL
jgi:hypothetical protein